MEFVLGNGLSPFSVGKSLIKSNVESIYKTRDAKAIHTKVLGKVSSGFVFSETVNLWNVFGFTSNVHEIKKRQEFFRGIGVLSSGYLGEMEKPRASWKPRYDVVVVTEDESTFVRLNKLGCGVQLLVNENDVMELERYDVVQVVDCDDFQRLLERLPQSVFLNSVEDVYLERYLEELSGWRENFAILNRAEVSEDVRVLLKELEPMFILLENKEGKIITESEVERLLEDVNEIIGTQIKEMMISGEA